MRSIDALLSYVDIGEVIRYGFVGFSSGVLFWGVFVVTHEILRVSYRWAQVVAFFPAFLLNFYLHKTWTFSALGDWHAEFLGFSLKKAGFFLLNMVCMHVLVEWLSLRPRYAQLLLIPTLGPAGYLVLKFLVFFK